MNKIIMFWIYILYAIVTFTIVTKNFLRCFDIKPNFNFYIITFSIFFSYYEKSFQKITILNDYKIMGNNYYTTYLWNTHNSKYLHTLSRLIVHIHIMTYREKQ